MSGVKLESFGFIMPAFVDKVKDCQTIKCLQPFSKVVSLNKGLQMIFEAIVTFVIVLFHSSFFNSSIHSFDLSVSPGVIGKC